MNQLAFAFLIVAIALTVGFFGAWLGLKFITSLARERIKSTGRCPLCEGMNLTVQRILNKEPLPTTGECVEMGAKSMIPHWCHECAGVCREASYRAEVNLQVLGQLTRKLALSFEGDGVVRFMQGESLNVNQRSLVLALVDTVISMDTGLPKLESFERLTKE